MKDKVRICYHEAGHVTALLLVDFPFKEAEIFLMDDGNHKGLTLTNRHTHPQKLLKHYVIKDTIHSLSGFIAEKIYLGKGVLDSFDIVDSPGSTHDFHYARNSCLAYMSEFTYDKDFKPLMLRMSRECLEKNWTAVQLIAEFMFKNNKITTLETKRIITELYKPDTATLDLLSNEIEWKNI